MGNIKLKNRDKLMLIITFVALSIGIIAYVGYWMTYKPNFNNEKNITIYIDKQTSFDSIIQILQDSVGCKSINSFKRLATYYGYPNEIKPGKYKIEPHLNNLEMLKKLSRGKQTPTNITFNNIRTNEDLSERVAAQLMLSASELTSLLEDSAFCASYGFTRENIKCMFIPNTYEVYWDITPTNLFKRMKKEYDTFWSSERLAKAKEIGLTPDEVAVLASIVEEETAAVDEMPIVAGLYINRLQKGIPLQADPTVKFAVGDFTLKRILFTHLAVDSPYNTYKNVGLPPGPLRSPSIRGIDAVLNFAKHNYLYMCAKEDLSGKHNFATTLSDHSRNAQKYRAELNRRKIY